MKGIILIRKVIAACLVLVTLISTGADFNLYINKSSVVLNELDVAFCTFNDSPEFETKNSILTGSIGETLNFTVTNTDTLVHSFTIDDVVDEEIEAGASISFSFTLEEAGTYRYYSNHSYGQQAGASGILLIGYEDVPAYYWNLFDLDDTLSHELAGNQTQEIPLDYEPELFFINGASFPETLLDGNTLIEVGLNDEIIISIVNSGNMEHVLHFHGFHVEILDVGIHNRYEGWIKDTVPLDCRETMTVKLIADQPGIYPVHDHNLIAVTNIGFYPGGMLTQIVVE